MAISINPAVSAAIAEARNLPQLIARLQAVDPALAASLESKPLIASKTPWGTILVAVLAWASARYGFGWDQTTDALVGGIGVLIGSYAMRALSPSYISGLFKTPTTPPTVPNTATATAP